MAVNSRLAVVAALAVSAFAQNNVELTTSGGNLIAVIPEGGDFVVAQSGGNPVGMAATFAEQRSSLMSSVSTLDAAQQNGESTLRSTLVASNSTLREALVASESTIQSQMTSGFAQVDAGFAQAASLLDDGLAEVAAAAESRAAVSDAAAQAAAAELSILKGHLLPGTPTFTVAATPFGAKVTVDPVFSVMPYNVTIYFTNQSTANQDISQWQSTTITPRDQFEPGTPSDTFRVGGMAPEQPYSIKVGTVSAVGNSEPAATRNFRTTVARGADTFGCHRRMYTCAAGRTCTVCEVAYAVGVRSFMYTGITGTYKANGNSWVALGVSYNNDNTDPSTRANQAKSNGVGRSRQWEQIHAARASAELTPGRHTIKLQFKCTGSGSCQLQNVGLQGMVVLKENGALSGSCRGAERVSMRWATKVCEINFRASVPSIDVMSVNGGIYTGHYYVNGAYDNERGRWEGSRHSPAHSYARDYESYGTGRAVTLSAGAHTVTANGFHGSATYWKAGISHLLFPADRSHFSRQAFKRWPGWGQHANRNGRALITQTIDLPYDSLVMAQFAGHYRAQGGNQCFGMVMFDNDMQDWFRSNTDMYADRGEHMVASGRSTQWENMQSKRFKVLARGRHTVSVWLRAESTNCWLNGMGMDGFWTRSF